MKYLITFGCTLFWLSLSPVVGQSIPPISSVETSVPVFIGYSQKAVYQKRNATNRAIRISSFAAYEQIYGASTPGYYLRESVQLFFQNGGKTCYIISVATTANPVQKQTLDRGLEISSKAPAQLMLIPDAVALPPSDFYDLQQAMIDLCAEQKDRFAILNTLAPGVNAQQDIQDFRSSTHANDLSWAAVYYPWLITTDGTQVPPSGAVAGAFTQTDQAKGVWKAPANVSLSGVQSLTKNLSSSEQSYANLSPSDGKSINAIARFTGKGILVWGARTLAGNDNEWRYVPVRRFAMMVENSLQQGLNRAVFEPNDANLWTNIRSTASNYLSDLWRKGALQGTKPDQAFFVKCGQGTTITAQDVLENRLIVEIGMAVVRPAEFLIIRIEMKMQ